METIPSPCYVLEENKLRSNLELLNEVQLRSGAKIILALKGFAMHSVFSIVAEYLKGTTASSLHEARLGKEEFGGEVHVYSPAYMPNEFAEILNIAEHITFNSLSQWHTYADDVRNQKREIRSALRINPECSEVSTALYDPCAAGSRLGITAEQLGDKLPPGISGLHFHNLCEKDSYALERTLHSVEAKFGHLLHQCEFLNMGGGHLITGRNYDTEHLISLIIEMRKKYDIEVILEPGSAVAWETGYLISTVLDIVENKGIHTALLDISFTAHAPDCLEMPYKPQIENAVEPKQGKSIYRMGGNSCLAGDFVGDYCFEKPLKIDDQIKFKDMIHYTMVKNNTFNGVNLPSIGILDAEGCFKLIKKFGYEDYKGRLS